jgi:hypothetical protein
VEPRARVSVWPGRRRVPGIVAPDSWGARGAECLPRDVPRRTPPAIISCLASTARRGLCHRTGFGTTQARPPKQCPRQERGEGFVAPHGESRGGFWEQQQQPPPTPFARGGISLSRLGWGRTTETLAQHNRHLGVAAAGAVKANFAACQRGSPRVIRTNDDRPRTFPAGNSVCLSSEVVFFRNRQSGRGHVV